MASTSFASRSYNTYMWVVIFLSAIFQLNLEVSEPTNQQRCNWPKFWLEKRCVMLVPRALCRMMSLSPVGSYFKTFCDWLQFFLISLRFLFPLMITRNKTERFICVLVGGGGCSVNFRLLCVGGRVVTLPVCRLGRRGSTDRHIPTHKGYFLRFLTYTLIFALKFCILL